LDFTRSLSGFFFVFTERWERAWCSPAGPVTFMFKKSTVSYKTLRVPILILDVGARCGGKLLQPNKAPVRVSCRYWQSTI
jgi:hypothetical protein